MARNGAAVALYPEYDARYYKRLAFYDKLARRDRKIGSTHLYDYAGDRDE